MNIFELFEKPNIISNKGEFLYEKQEVRNYPKLIIVLNNKIVDIKNEDPIQTGYNGVTINYNNTDPASSENIYNYISKAHAKLIVEHNILTSNETFAYHFLIDKMGNIYEGRPIGLRAANLDIFDSKGKPNKNINLKDYLVILTEEDTSEVDTTERTYASLKSLIKYLKYSQNIKEFYGYSELNKYDLSVVKNAEEDLTRYNNPGLFFRMNELHSAVDNTPKTKYIITPSNYTVYTYGTRSIAYTKHHASGNDIQMLQVMLYNLEYFKNYTSINGAYDLNTKNAVEKFQKDQNIIPEFEYGTADINTLNIIRNNIYKIKMAKKTIFDDNQYTFRTLEYLPNNMMVGYDVKLVQTLLKQKLFYSLENSGIYDEYTKNIVKLFQRIIYGGTANADGKVGPSTLDALNRCLYKTPKDGKFKFNDNNTIAYSENVLLLQKALNIMLKKYEMGVKENGYYNNETASIIAKINNFKDNRTLMGIEYYDPEFDPDSKDNQYLYWNDINNLKTCYPEEFEWILSKYLFEDDSLLKIKI